MEIKIIGLIVAAIIMTLIIIQDKKTKDRIEELELCILDNVIDLENKFKNIHSVDTNYILNKISVLEKKNELTLLLKDEPITDNDILADDIIKLITNGNYLRTNNIHVISEFIEVYHKALEKQSKNNT